ncbi:inner membrane ABC transporter permease protein YjfF [Pleomorphomonas sp. SM30]|uniref:Nucleoside ABC transporter membrane protein n=2 Tax=Oharaeibacter diazotrophicus TaxID=1920512 RepID=A0A4R6R826_9HYPH|nr:ABC transporter permease [Oharaeibacter diazotrophicus]TDP81915.1 nucleoside ABC transporter membrane protein [Oharaeibacter diazotrophicus]BBE73547.1 inner membrane ABC transporter permease protein YjfF [Pleomorphomonas sp. SM30]GLS75337.1 ABC transporter permease [Oharaeibacter diazotrophicus]
MSSESARMTTSPPHLPRPRLGPHLHRLATVVGPVLAALVLAGLVLLALGVDPLAYYGTVVQRGLLSPTGLQASLTRMAPLLLIAAGLIVAFRAGIWNLGGDGQFLLGAVVVAALGPALVGTIGVWPTLVACLVVGAAVGAVWSVLPALLKAGQGVNEIITTLMMTFLGVSFANVLVKLAFRDPGTTVPQTRTLDVADRLPRLFDTTVSSGLLIGLVAVIGVHLLMTRTAFGLKLRVVGANTRAAVHAGLSVPKLTVAVFAISAALSGLAGAVEILGVQGNVRADWNPAYSLTVVPLVFLARFNGFATIAFVFLFSVLSIGGESAARRLGVPNYFTLVVVAILLVLLGLAEYLDQRRRLAGK